jgi:bud site selection protein 20
MKPLYQTLCLFLTFKMSRLARSRKHRGIRDNQRKWRTRVRKPDFDQVHARIHAETPVAITKTDDDIEDALELPGGGQFECVACSTFFISMAAKESHEKSKIHRKRLKKAMTEQPYTQKDAELAVGLTTA